MRARQPGPVDEGAVGGGTEDSSGKLFLAFSTADQPLPPAGYGRSGVAFSQGVAMVNNDHISPLFRAEAVPAREGRRLLTALRQTGWKPADPV